MEPVLRGHYGDLMFSVISVICLIWQNLSFLSYVAESLSPPSPEFILHCIALPLIHMCMCPAHSQDE